MIKLKKFKKKVFFFNNFFLFKKKFTSKLDKVILGVPGLSGLKFAFFLPAISKNDKKASLTSILKKAKANTCKITSIDSEHFCIKQIIKDKSLNEIDSVFLTASGGPFLKKKESSYSRASIAKVTNHPKWSMGGQNLSRFCYYV